MRDESSLACPVDPGTATLRASDRPPGQNFGSEIKRTGQAMTKSYHWPLQEIVAQSCANDRGDQTSGKV